MSIKVTKPSVEENHDSAHELALACAHAASDKKASDISILNVSKLTTYTDFFVICSAPSDRQVQAIVANVQDKLRDQKMRPLGVEGLETSSWILLDYGSVVFHCFTDSAREYYNLDGLWAQADKVDFVE